MKTDEIRDTVTRLFIAADNRDWPGIKQVFADEVFLDYTSMSGGEPSLLKAEQVIDGWRGLLPGFDKTHHQIGNFLVKIRGRSATAFCYGTASHYLANESNNDLWTVVGSYEFELAYIRKAWRITKMKFNMKYADGNPELPQMARERAAP